MRIKELIALLEDQDPELTIVLSTDAEGNRFRKWDGYSLGRYEDGEFIPETECYSVKTAVCLWPA